MRMHQSMFELRGTGNLQVQARILTQAALLLSLPVGQVSLPPRQKQQALCTLLTMQNPVPAPVPSSQGRKTSSLNQAVGLGYQRRRRKPLVVATSIA